FLRHLAFVVVDECHAYRGVFGSHVAHVLRRLRRLADAAGAGPAITGPATTGPATTGSPATGRPATGSSSASQGSTGRTRTLTDPARGALAAGLEFLLASATAGEPAEAASRLTGLEVAAVTEDASPRGAVTFVLWEPPLLARDPGGAGRPGFADAAPVRRSALAESADLLAAA